MASTSFTINDVEAHRKASTPLTGLSGPVTSSDLFKSPRCFTKPKSKDFGHRFSEESKARAASDLKVSGSSLTSDVISLGTGRPSPAYFPFDSLELRLPKPPFHSKAISQVISASRSITKDSPVYDLAIALNYGYSAGSEQLVRFITEHVDIVHDPPYADWASCLTIGSTSALEMAFRMFCTRGDYVLVEDYTFSGALECLHPLGLKVAGVKMDSYGMSAVDLDSVISNWDTAQRNAPKPFLLYMIPTGHNPTGLTQSTQRRHEIYQVAEKHDLYIIEDDPYYFLQFEKYDDEGRSLSTPSPSQYLDSLLPSYLSLDTSGRVLRLDSTSKILSPGLRCGWMTAKSDVIERFLYHHDVSIISPSGLSQLAMHNLLEEVWGHKGFVEWLIYLRTEYSQRGNTIIEACEAHLPKTVCSWQVPQAGMFHWIKINWKSHSLVAQIDGGPLADTLLDIEDRIYNAAMAKGVVCCKGSTFRAGKTHTELFLRTTFATASLEMIGVAISRFGAAIREEFRVEA